MRDRNARGLTLGLRYTLHKRLKDREITERRQVGDAQEMMNRGDTDPGYFKQDNDL